MRQEPRDRIPLPIKVQPVSNGEYLPPAPSAVVREAVRRTLAVAEIEGPRHGMDRRAFLRSLMGAATMLGALAACSSESSSSTSTTSRGSSSSGTGPGGTFRVPSTATTDPDAARDLLAGDEFVFDVQTHLLEFDLDEPNSGVAAAFAAGFPYARCGDADWRACFSVEHWTEELFLRSDTSMAVISAVPILANPNPLSIRVMEDAKRVAEQVCGDGRIFMHGQVNPNVGDLAVSLDGMRALRDEHEIAAWKVYTHVPGGAAWWLDDHDPQAVQCGRAFLDTVIETGPPIVCVHKGLGTGSEHASPVDIGPAAAAYPDLAFVVYHSGYETTAPEGAYDADGAGVDRLVRSLGDAGIGPGANVYAELGSTWYLAMRDPDRAAHVIGKLLLAVGEDRVLWGTDSIWYGTPQDQIQAWRTFEITPEFQERFGYPALTDTVKRKVLGINAARLYGVEPVRAACDASPADIEAARAALPASYPVGPRNAAEVVRLAAARGGLP